MIKGIVTAQVWSSKRLESIPQGALLEIRTESGGTLVALDTLGCGQGEQVLVATGSVAAARFADVRATIDALIIASVDEKT